ncbi:lipid A biosynthesis lauroyl acyltransferase [uncultured Helicobacter sp.]|uniref:lipid A biosynthesis lauroyl acyltransferase n=1 Tax=uncultured Helicobacter sp. TaxID=175537 RepID=UPI00374EA438
MLKPATLLLEIASSALGWYLAHIPHRFFVWHIRALGHLFRTLDKRRYSDAYANLEFVYGENLAHDQKHAIIRRCYDNFAFVLLESIRVVYINPHTYASRFRFTNEHFITESIAKDGGAVLISAHFGYWEAMATILPPRYRMCQMASLGRLTQFKSINHMIIKRRESNGVRMIDKKGAFKHLLKMYAQKNALVGILIDQNIGLNEGIEVEFFGKRATHTTIASVLSRRFGVAIVPVFIDFNDDYSRYEVRFYEPIRVQNTSDMTQDISQATQIQAHITQKVIESNPSSWFWFHKRFKVFYPEIYQKK